MEIVPAGFLDGLDAFTGPLDPHSFFVSSWFFLQCSTWLYARQIFILLVRPLPQAISASSSDYVVHCDPFFLLSVCANIFFSSSFGVMTSDVHRELALCGFFPLFSLYPP